MAGFTGTSCVRKTESSRCTATPPPGRSISIWLTRVSFPRFLNHIPEGRRRFRRRSQPASRWFGNACRSKSEDQSLNLSPEGLESPILNLTTGHYDPNIATSKKKQRLGEKEMSK